MKKLLFSAFMLCFALSTFAQSAGAKSTASEDTQLLVKMFNLDAKQSQQMLVIQQRKYRNLAEIESLKTSNPDVYAKKIQAIDYGTDASVRRLLNKEQMRLYRNNQAAERKKRAANKMKKE